MGDGVRVFDCLERKIGYDRYMLIAVAVAPEQMCTGVPGIWSVLTHFT